MKIRLLLWVIIFTLVSKAGYSQTVVVSDDSTNLTGNASAVLDLKSITRGLLPPRMTESQKNAISSPAVGLLIYQTDNTPGFYFYNGSSWVSIAYGGGGASQWTTATNDIYYNIGKVGIGTSSPSTTLHVKQSTPTTGAVTVSRVEGVQDAGVNNVVISEIVNSSASSSKTALRIGGSASTTQWLIGNDSAGNNGQNFYLYDLGSDAARLYINSSGNIGLGTTAPTERLHVSGNLRLTGAIMPNNTAGTSGYVLTSAGAGAAPTWTDPNSYIAAGWQLNGNTLSSLKTLGTLSFHDLPIVTNNIEKMRIMADGKVGIGKSNPSEILDVVGNMRLSGAFMPNNSSGTSGYFLTSAGTNAPPTWTDPATLAWKPDGNTYSTTKTFGTNSSHDIPIITAGSEKMRIMTSGRVGIGTATPGEILDVVGNVRFSGAIMPNNTAGTSGLYLTSAGAGAAPTWSEAWKPDGNTITGTKSIGTVSFTDLPIITNNVEKVRIKADGKVGIGNSSPAEILDVTGNVKFSGALMPNNSAGTLGYFLTSAGTNAPPTWTDPSLLAWKPNGNTFFAEKSFGTVSYHDLPFITANSEKMRILADGKVGIGTVTPTQALDVVGAIKFSNALMPNNTAGNAGEFLMSAGASTVPTWSTAWKPGGNDMNASGTQNFGPTSYHDLPFITAGTEAMRIKADGKVGIGTNAPSELLHVTGNMRLNGAFMPGNAAGTSGQFLMSAGTNTAPTWAAVWKPGGNDMNASGVQNLGTTTYHALPFITNNAEAMRIHPDGNVSIGNTTTSEKLNITGNMRLSGAFMPNNDAGTAGYLLTSGGSNSPATWVSVSSVAAPAAGSTNIITLGTVTTGTWNASQINAAKVGGGSVSTAEFDLLDGAVGSPLQTQINAKAASGANTDITSVSLNQGGLVTKSSSAFGLTIRSFESLAAARTLSLVVGAADRTLTMGGNITTAGDLITSGANSLTLTTTGATNVTLPTTGTLVNTAVATLSSLTSVGTIGTGTWQGTLINPTYGGTGVNNGSRTITLGNNLTTSGNFALTLTQTGITNVTLPTTGTLATTAATTLSSLSSIGTITTGVWNGTLISPTYGGTGINNGSNTLTLAGSLATSGANALTLTTTGATNVTLPTTGTLVNTAVTTLSSLTSVGTIGTGVWQGTVVNPTYGGTGVNNGSNTLTLGGTLTTAGANALTLTTTGATNVTLPTTGTLVNTAVTTLSSLSSIGTITTGTWNGTVVNPTYGGTGVNNGSNTLTLAGSLATSGANALTLTTTGATNVTLPASGTLLSDAALVTGAQGGTGVNNSGKTITLGNNLTTSGNFALTLTQTGATNVTLPTSGTLLSDAALVSGAQGGTGVNNSGKTITLGGNLTTSGANAVTLTTAGATSVTLPTSGTLLSTAAVVTAAQGGTGQSSYAVGDMLYASGAAAIGKISPNTSTSKMFLTQTGTGSAGALPIWQPITAADVPGALIGVQKITATGGYKPTTGVTKIVVHMVGAGGGGGGADGSGSRIAAAGGGGGGGYLLVEITGMTTDSFACVIGAGGTSGANTGGNGGAGGASTFQRRIPTVGTLYTANGGSGGTGSVQANGDLRTFEGGRGAAVSSNGFVNAGGTAGTMGIRLSNSVGNSGTGGGSMFGGGGDGYGHTGATSAGDAGTGYGSGGGGGFSEDATDVTGGVGAPGLIVIYEYR